MYGTKTKLLTAIAAGLAAAAIAPGALAGSAPQGEVTIPERLANTQYPGTSSKPTVNLKVEGRDSLSTTGDGSVRRVTIPAWLTRISYPGSYPRASVIVPRTSDASDPATEPASPARGFDWPAFGVGIAAALGMTLMGASALLALRRRRTPAHG